jgi:CRISPR-associated protein Csb3
LLDACDRVRARALKGEVLLAATPMTKRFGVDPRSSWISLDIGYSPNDQKTGAIHTRPFTELLAMIGLQTFLPRKRESREFVYHIWHSTLPLLPARLAFAGVTMPVPSRRYRFTVSKSGSFSVFDFAELEE